MIDGTAALQFDYISDVPWEKSPAFTFSNDTKAYLEAFDNAIDKIPTKDLKISFDDDVWDFNPYFTGPDVQQHKFIFTNLPDDLALYCKFFVLYRISGKVKVVTVNVRYSLFVSIITNIFERTTHKSIYVVTTDDIIAEINRRGASPSTVHGLFQSAYQMYSFLVRHYHLELPVDLSVLDEEAVKWSRRDKQIETKNKLPDIPSDYFDAILKKCTEVMRNKAANTSDRMMAASIVFISQTGLRLTDFLSLTIDALHVKKLAKSGTSAYFLHCTERKPSKAHQPLIEFDIPCNELTAEAFKLMKRLRKKSPLSKGNEILFIINNYQPGRQPAKVPHTRNRWHSVYTRFFYYYLPEAQMEWEGIAPSKYHPHPYREKQGKETHVTLYIPDTRQYRVHVCTELYEAGVPLTYIQQHMGHLTEAMQGYYVRPKDTYQENISYSEKVIREIAGENVTPLGGGSALGEEIKSRIKDFIEKNHFNIETDIEKIVKALGDKVVIRGKAGGVCIKTSLVPCPKDARTDELMCAYNLCPNLYHFYYMADISYLDFKTLQETYNAAKEKGQTKAAQKELAKIKDVLNRRLIPEMKELSVEIHRNGTNVILERHPSLLDILKNREKIKLEIDEWLAKH